MNTANRFGSNPAPTGSPPNLPPSVKTPCRKCRNPIDRNDAYCRYCGTSQSRSEAFYYHPVWILLLAFLVLGPFALGLVWRSRRMDRPTKIVLATVILVYSAVSLYAVYQVGMIEYREISTLVDLM